MKGFWSNNNEFTVKLTNKNEMTRMTIFFLIFLTLNLSNILCAVEFSAGF